MRGKIQYDGKVRVVALANLVAMCEQASSVGHTWTVVKVGKNRVHVEYSNPNEYGAPDPQTAVFPCFPNPFGPGEEDNPFVVIGHFCDIRNDPDGTAHQAFEQLTDGPELFRTNPDTDDWRTR